MSTKEEVKTSSYSQLLFEKLLILFSFLLFLYSFTQVDLGLTLTRASFIATIQHAFQHVGYFNRPLSTLLFIVLLIALTSVYYGYLFLTKRQALSSRILWRTIFIVGGLLTLSYTAFSYDIFNYIFDAKIVTLYHQNPYLHKALDFPGDPMLSFMHWTHRTYPYGPFWLGVTIPLSYVGLQFFLPTYFLFKALALGGYLLTIYSISRIAKIISPSYEKLSIVFFAFNPLVLIESLVSGHNDIIMMGIGMYGIYLFLRKRYAISFLLLVLSAGIKYATGFVIPLFIILYLFERKDIKIPWNSSLMSLLVAMGIAFGAIILRSGSFQPWYLLVVLPFASLLVKNKYILIPSLIISVGALFNYVPFFYVGNWNPPIPSVLLQINLLALLLAITCGIAFYLKDRHAVHK